MKEQTTSIKLAIADDHTLLRECMITALNGIKEVELLSVVKDIDQLLNLITDNIPDIPDIVLIHIEKADYIGMSILQKLKIKHPDLKVIVTTFEYDDDFIIDLLENGANSFLFKDSSLKELEKAIKKVHLNQFYYNEHVQDLISRQHYNKRIKKKCVGKQELNDIEMQVLVLICKGARNPQIAEKLYLSIRTIEGYKKRIQNKLGVKNQAELIYYAIKNKLVPPPIKKGSKAPGSFKQP